MSGAPGKIIIIIRTIVIIVIIINDMLLVRLHSKLSNNNSNNGNNNNNETTFSIGYSKITHVKELLKTCCEEIYDSRNHNESISAYRQLIYQAIS